MNYQEFLDYIKENLAKYLAEYQNIQSRENKSEEREEDYVVEIHRVLKNNGVVLDGLTIRKQEENCSPNLYLNPYFDQYQMGRPITTIIKELVCRYSQAKIEGMITVADLADYESVKDRIVLRLVNFEKNESLLKSCPHKRYMDLAITFRYMVGKDPVGIATSLISNQEFEAWNVEFSELYQVALFNTMREFPWKMDSLAKVISDYLKDKAPGTLPEDLISEIEHMENSENGVSMFVLTNDTGINGATCILYDNVIKNFAKVQESNIFILPSSVHEVMLVPENAETETEFLEALVREANDSAVGLIDLLSDNIYYYDRERDECMLYN
ncbi:MAG: hypothetical protein K2I10_09625, partial [Lachnospiraceae bacterium]|nr:hypothetical protein [Lachnospiraceae bacterium]